MIRKMELKDIEEVSGIWANVFAPKLVGNKEKIAKELTLKFTLSPQFCFVFEKRGRIIGFIMGGKWDEDIISLGPLAVVKEKRGKGIGKALVERFEEEARKAGFSSIILTTRFLGEDEESKKYEASLFYLKQGFKEIARSKKKRIMFKRIG